MQKKNIYQQQINDPDFEFYSITDHLIDSSAMLDRTVSSIMDQELKDLMILAKAVDMVKDLKDDPMVSKDTVLDNLVAVAEIYLNRRQEINLLLMKERQTDRALLDSALMRDDQKH